MKQQTQNKIEWKEVELGEILDYEQPTKYIVEKTNYSDDYEIPVLTAGKSFILGYSDEKKGVCENLPVIIFDDFTTANKYVDFKFKVKSSAMKILRSKNDNIDLKFAFLAMQRLKFDVKRHKRYYLSAYQKIKIPLPFCNNKPDLETQQKIASILEKAETLKQKRKNADELLDEYLKAVFWEMFGDPNNPENRYGSKDFIDCIDKKISNNKLKIPQKDFLERGEFAIIDQGEKFIAGYTNDKSKVYNEKFPVIVFGDHTRVFKFIDFPFSIGADGVKILVPSEEFNPLYLPFKL